MRKHKSESNLKERLETSIMMCASLAFIGIFSINCTDVFNEVRTLKDLKKKEVAYYSEANVDREALETALGKLMEYESLIPTKEEMLEEFDNNGLKITDIREEETENNIVIYTITFSIPENFSITSLSKLDKVNVSDILKFNQGKNKELQIRTLGRKV